MNKLTYIASGCSFMRIIFKEAFEDPECNLWINSAFKRMQSNPDHTFGLLYNAWTESKFGEVFKENFRPSLECIQADSGGLQIITQGKEITEEMKKKVYENQGAYSDMAMSFDEIPLGFSGEKSSRLDLSNRWFDSAKFDACARQTGKNVFEQIKTFVDMKSSSRPIFIVQGNCYDTYMKWTELALSEIPKEYHQYLGGIAMGAAALGHGALEDIQRAFIYTQLPIEVTHRHMHLLAVGSVARLMPNLIFLQTGVYSDMHLTLDSTTHTSGTHMGRFYINNNNLDFPRHFDRVIYERIYNDVIKEFDFGLSLEGFHEALNSPTIPYKEKHGSRIPLIKAFVAITLRSIQNFKSHVDLCLSSKKELLKLANDKADINTFNTLYQVRTKDDFDSWMRDIGRHVKSKPVVSAKPSSLEEFF